MTEPPRSDPAGAGLTLVSTIILCGGIGLGLGALVGLPAPLGVAGVFVGAVVGVALVYARFKDV
jgi:hypothetical protein